MTAESHCQECDFHRSATFTKGDAWLYDAYGREIQRHETTTGHHVRSVVRFPDLVLGGSSRSNDDKGAA